MKKYSIVLSVLAAVSFSACTLYMDEPEDAARILRTGEGYDEKETIALPSGEGTVTYKYNQKTIPINEEVEQYIVKVESDSIIYFNSAMPDDLLPVVGEMMTCGFRDLFPRGFCHKCIERTEQKDVCRCVFSQCEYGDAFDVLDAHFDGLQLTLSEGTDARYLTEAEKDSLLGGPNYVDSVAATRGVTRIGYNESVKVMTIPIKGQLEVSALPSLDIANAKASIGGEIILGGWLRGDYSLSGKSADFEIGLVGGIGITVDVQAQAGGMTFKSPFSATPLGFRFDLFVASGRAGFVIDPYLSVHHEVYGHAELALGIDAGIHYVKDSNDPNGTVEITHSGSEKRFGNSPFLFRANESENEGFDINMEMGTEYSVGLGFKVFGGAADAEVAIGYKQYGVMKLSIDKNEYQSVEKFQQKNADFPTYSEAYVGATVGIMWVAGKPSIVVGPVADKVYKIPYFPVSNNQGTMRCVDMKSKLYSAEAILADPGLITNWWTSYPKLRIYDAKTKELVKIADLKWGKNSKGLKTVENSIKIPELEFNHEYISQFTLDMGDLFSKAYFPLEEVPFHLAKPEMELYSVECVKTQTPQNGATLEEIGNPKIVVSDGVNKGFVFGNKVYNYRYKFDVKVIVKGLTKLSRWGIEISNSFGRKRDFYVDDNSGKLNASYIVRMTWYSSKAEEDLIFDAYTVGLNENGKKTFDREYFESIDYVAEYKKALDSPISITDQTYYNFEQKSRGFSPSLISVHSDSNQFGDDMVLGDIEVIPLD